MTLLCPSDVFRVTFPRYKRCHIQNTPSSKIIRTNSQIAYLLSSYFFFLKYHHFSNIYLYLDVSSNIPSWETCNCQPCLFHKAPVYLFFITLTIFIFLILLFLSTFLISFMNKEREFGLAHAYRVCCFCSLSKSHQTLCNPMDCSTPGFPVLHYLPEFAQTHAHWVPDAIQPSHPLSSLSPPALNFSQHQGLFQ